SCARSSATTPPTRASSSPSPASATAGSRAKNRNANLRYSTPQNAGSVTQVGKSAPDTARRLRCVGHIRVGIVPHTHWDREWYAPFQTFRLRLVKLLDELLPMLEHDTSYARFLLDGQTAVLD